MKIILDQTENRYYYDGVMKNKSNEIKKGLEVNFNTTEAYPSKGVGIIQKVYNKFVELVVSHDVGEYTQGTRLVVFKDELI